MSHDIPDFLQQKGITSFSDNVPAGHAVRPPRRELRLLIVPELVKQRLAMAADSNPKPKPLDTWAEQANLFFNLGLED
ncbi:MAG: hypothetical protein GY703_09575 [Gammaproteobacteria bacterium]|nr:hypothetical protein [Gammaproteobacteria bacterium]